MEKVNPKEAADYFSNLHNELDQRAQLRKEPEKTAFLGPDEAVPNTKDLRHAHAMRWLRQQTAIAQEYFLYGNVKRPLD